MQKLTERYGVVMMGLLGGLLLAAWSGVAYADHLPSEAVSRTKHNLAENPNILLGTTTAGASEVCVFCHTPHGAGYSALLPTGFPPLWNRKINVSTTYDTYETLNSPHFEDSSGASLAVNKVKGVSLACLSCHDGTIAFDALINLQGSGGLQAANLAPGDGTDPGERGLAQTLFGGFTGEAVDETNFTFNASPVNRVQNAAGNVFGGSLFGEDTLGTVAGALGSAGTQPFPNLTTDLADDHPISFEIPCGGTGAGCDPQFTELIAGSVADPNTKLLYLKRDLDGVAGTGVMPVDKRDRLRAYASEGGATFVTTGSNVDAYIECASCHNPHTPRTLFLRLPSGVNNLGVFADSGTGLTPALGDSAGGASAAPGVTNGIFWSHAPNQASAICISCHQK